MQSISNSNDEVTHRRPMIKDILFYPDPNYRPLCKPIRTPTPGSLQSTESRDINPEINIDFKEKFSISRRHNFRNIPKAR